VPILYRSKDSRRQNIEVVLPSTVRKEMLVLNDVVWVTIAAAEQAMKTNDWRLGYALTVHSLQG